VSATSFVVVVLLSVALLNAGFDLAQRYLLPPPPWLADLAERHGVPRRHLESVLAWEARVFVAVEERLEADLARVAHRKEQRSEGEESR